MRTKLSQKAKQEPRFRFYALYDRIYRLDVLQAAWSRVRKPRSAPGIDGVTFGDIEESDAGVPHDKLLAALQQRISDRSVLRLFRLWLACPMEETDEAGRRTRHRRPRAGTPQGGVVSPLLANIHLHWFEVLFYRQDGPAHWAKAELVRYADDFVVLARYQGERLRGWIETTLEGRFGLTINREKTKVDRLGPIGGEGLDFLGFTMRYERSILPGSSRYLHVGPSRCVCRPTKRFR